MVGRGIGQQDRVVCTRLCLQLAARAGHVTQGSVFASDAFFPYASRRKDEVELRRELRHAFDFALLPDGEATPFSTYAGIDALLVELTKLDTREGPDLLVDAGCVGGVVPADGKNLAEVQQYFADHGLAVAYVDAEHRGFAKH